MELLGDVGHAETCFFPFGDSISVGAWFALDVPRLTNRFGCTRWYLRWRGSGRSSFLPVWRECQSWRKIGARFHRTYHRLDNHFRCTRWNSKVTWVMCNLTSFCLETVLVSVQDRCTVYIKRAIGSEIILHAPNGTPRGRGSCGISLISNVFPNAKR